MPAHETHLRVRYGETDKAGVVYYANYLLYFEVARSAFMRDLGKSYAQVEREGVLLTVVDAHCKYLGSAHYEDPLTITTTVTKLTLTRVVFSHEVLREGTGDLIATGHTTLAALDSRSEPRKPCRLPEDLKQILETAMQNAG